MFGSRSRVSTSKIDQSQHRLRSQRSSRLSVVLKSSPLLSPCFRSLLLILSPKRTFQHTRMPYYPLPLLISTSQTSIVPALSALTSTRRPCLCLSHSRLTPTQIRKVVIIKSKSQKDSKASSSPRLVKSCKNRLPPSPPVSSPPRWPHYPRLPRRFALLLQ